MNTVEFDGSSNKLSAPRITFYYTDKTVMVPNGKNKTATPSREAIMCAGIASAVFSGQVSDYRLGALLPFFNRVKTDVATISDKTKMVEPGTILIEDINGKTAAVLRGRPTVGMLIDGMLKALSSSKFPVDNASLTNACACIKRICQLIDRLDETQKGLAAIATQKQDKKLAARMSAFKSQEDILTKKLDPLQKEMAATRAALSEFHARKPIEQKAENVASR